MLDPRALYTIEDDVWASVEGTRPTLVHLLDGYVDAGQVAKQLSEHLLGSMHPELMVTFDHDQLHDYRSRRPAMVFDTISLAEPDPYALERRVAASV